MNQVRPAIHLLSNLDELHPEVLRQHSIEPADYKSGLVFRSAIESIRGTFIASSTAGRQGMVKTVFEGMLERSYIADYEQTSSRYRHDFAVGIERNPDYFAALEVKGGEGNSINISERPVWAREFAVWCHLDGAVVNQPANGVHAIINRINNELLKRRKLVDVLLIKDLLCGTRARPCPKYPGHETETGLNTAPDVFLFPQRAPTLDDPEPPVHTLQSLRLPERILRFFGVSEPEQNRHIWEVRMKFVEIRPGHFRSVFEVLHKGAVVDSGASKIWEPRDSR
ncbi:MAG TPA: hypothetical protein VIP46_17175 [Pyrinomonadaceae bacterium]